MLRGAASCRSMSASSCRPQLRPAARAPSRAASSGPAQSEKATRFLQFLDTRESQLRNLDASARKRLQEEFPDAKNPQETLLDELAQMRSAVRANPALVPEFDDKSSKSLAKELGFLVTHEAKSEGIRATVGEDYDTSDHLYVENPESRIVLPFLKALQQTREADPRTKIYHLNNLAGAAELRALVAEAEGNSAAASAARSEADKHIAARKALISETLKSGLDDATRDNLKTLEKTYSTGALCKQRLRTLYGFGTPAFDAKVAGLEKELAATRAELLAQTGVDLSKIKAPQNTGGFYAGLLQ